MAHQPRIGVPTAGTRVLEGTQPHSISLELHPRSTLSHPSNKLDPRFPEDRAGSPDAHSHLPCCWEQPNTAPFPADPVFSLGPCWDMAAHRPQAFPPAPTWSPHCPGTATASPAHFPVSLLPQPLALTSECRRPLAPSRSRCLHCSQQLSQDLCQDHCPWCCTCHSPGSAAWGAPGSAACQAVGKSGRSPWRVWWLWGETLRGLCQDGSAGDAGSIPGGVTCGTFEGWLGAPGSLVVG